MINQAKLINETLGVKVLCEKDSNGKTPVQYTNKEIKALCVDDLLMNVKGETKIKTRLHILSFEIVSEAQNPKNERQVKYAIN